MHISITQQNKDSNDLTEQEICIANENDNKNIIKTVYGKKKGKKKKGRNIISSNRERQYQSFNSQHVHLVCFMNQ